MAYMKSISMYSIMLQNPLLTYTNKIGPGPRFSVVPGAKDRHQLSYWRILSLSLSLSRLIFMKSKMRQSESAEFDLFRLKLISLVYVFENRVYLVSNILHCIMNWIAPLGDLFLLIHEYGSFCIKRLSTCIARNVSEGRLSVIFFGHTNLSSLLIRTVTFDKTYTCIKFPNIFQG